MGIVRAMFQCPNCDTELVRTKVTNGFVWICGKCAGRAITLPVLRRLVAGPAVQQLWSRTFDETLPHVHPCPLCKKTMRQVHCEGHTGGFALDVCCSCQLVWFDPEEFEAMPAPPAPRSETEVPLEVRQQLAIATVKEQIRVTKEAGPSLGDIGRWPALFGLPVEIDDAATNSRPLATWTTAILVAAVSIVALAQPELLEELAMVPDLVWQSGGVTMVTSFFVHAGWWHLIGNLYFLLVFGDNVEDFLGRGRWLLLLLSATIGGGLLQILGEPRGLVPCVGASGGISGLIAFYALRFPEARLGVFIGLFYVPVRWVTFSARTGFILWLLIQGVLLWKQVSGNGSVAAFAHLGGALVGVLAWLACGKSK